MDKKIIKDKINDCYISFSNANDISLESQNALAKFRKELMKEINNIKIKN